MAKLWKRIKGRIAMTVSGFRNDCRFSLKLAIYRMMDDLCWRFGPRKVAEIFHKKKDQWIMAFLERELQYVVDTYKDDNNLGMPHENAPIWVCWWTGEETAPELVKQCIRSIRKNAGSHPVYLITKFNYKDYLEIPEIILDKVNSGEMCVANFSDYLRFSLLAKYGGFWMDATIFCNNDIDKYWPNPLFTCKGKTGDSRYISDYRWTGFCIGGNQGHVLFRFMSAALGTYWETHKAAVDYLLVDYTLNLGYSMIASIRQGIDLIADNNLRRDDLQAAMNDAVPAEEWSTVVQPDTVFYKLSWRETYRETTQDGKDSIYRYFLNKEI